MSICMCMNCRLLIYYKLNLDDFWKSSAHQEALKREIERLRQVYHKQNQKKMENNGTHSPTPTPTPPATADVKASAEKEQLLNV